MKQSNRSGTKRRWTIRLGLLLTIALGVSLVVILAGPLESDSHPTASTLTPLPSLTPIPPTPTPLPTTTAPPSSIDGEAGFNVWIDNPGVVLPADGLSSISVYVTTTRPEFVNSKVVLSAAGGGRVAPAETVLPSLNKTISVTYYTGKSTSTVQIEGRVTHGFNTSMDSASLKIVVESLTLETDYDAPLPGSPPTLPVTVKLTGTGPDHAVRGQYQVWMSVVKQNGSVTTALGSSAQSSGKLEFTLYDVDGDGIAQQTLYFTPLSGEQAIIQTRLLGRDDVPASRLVIYWSGIESRTALINLPGGESRNAPEAGRRLQWNLWDNNSLCAWSYDAQGRVIIPARVQVRYDVLLSPDPGTPHLALDRTLIPAGEWVSSDDTGANGLPYLIPKAPTCITQWATYGQAGLIRVSLAGVLHSRADEVLIWQHFGGVNAGSLRQPVVLRIPSLDPAVTLALTLESQNLMLYRLSPQQAGVPQVVSFAAWIPAENVDLAHSTLRAAAGYVTIPLVFDVDAYERGVLAVELEVDQAAVAPVWIAADISGQPFTTTTKRDGEIISLYRVYMIGEVQ